jgi:hypothetical protein
LSLPTVLAGAPQGEVSVRFRNGWVKNLRLVLTSAGGVALFLALFELLQRQPMEGFRLLTDWGPWPVVVLVALAIFGRFLSRMNDTVSVTFGAVVKGVQQGAEAQAKTADALTRLAEQGGRHAQEVERLTIYAAQEFPLLYERLDRQDAMLSAIHEIVRGGPKDNGNDGV